MKSANLQAVFQRVCGGCEQICAEMMHFASEQVRSKICRVAGHGVTPLQVSEVFALISAAFAEIAVVPRIICVYPSQFV